MRLIVAPFLPSCILESQVEDASKLGFFFEFQHVVFLIPRFYHSATLHLQDVGISITLEGVGVVCTGHFDYHGLAIVSGSGDLKAVATRFYAATIDGCWRQPALEDHFGFFRIYVLINMTDFTCKSLRFPLVSRSNSMSRYEPSECREWMGAVTVLNNFDGWIVQIMFDDFGTDRF